MQRACRPDTDIDEATVAWALAQRSGMPFPVLEGATSPSRYQARARIVANRIVANRIVANRIVAND